MVDHERVLVFALQTGRSADGTSLDLQAAAVCTVRGGLLRSVGFYATREQALDAVA